MPVWWVDKDTGAVIPKCSDLFIDKLSMTLHIPDIEKDSVLSDFQHVMNEFDGGKIWQSKTYYYNKRIYFDGEYVLFQCAPKNQGASWFRIELNPSKVDPADVAGIVNLILKGGYKELIKYGRITRIDIATDITRLLVGDLLCCYPGTSISKNYLKSGSIQSAYLGANSSPNMFNIYDKVAEIEAKNSYHKKLFKKGLPKYVTTRVELRHKPGNKICTFNNLYPGKNAFEKLELVMITGQPPKPLNDFDGLVDMVFRLSKYEGLQQALYGVPKHRRKEIKELILKYGMTQWWKPSELWETLPTAIEHIISPKLNHLVAANQ